MKRRAEFLRSSTALIVASSFVVVAITLSPSPALAEEGGTGHYVPGTISSRTDGVSPKEVFILRLNAVRYDGGFDANRVVPIAGQAALDVGVESTALALTLFWRPSWGELAPDLSYAMNATLPIVWVDVDAKFRTRRDGFRQRRDDDFGLGDVILTPLMLNYHVNDDLNLNGRFNIYTPTGDYELGRLANTGKNYWTFEPMIALMYLGQDNGREASIFFGVDFNSENLDTSYDTGTQLHLDGTLAQHFPLGGGLAGVGVTGYWYQQVEGDSGSGAILGAFKGRTHGVGPSITYTRPVGGHNLIAEFKWVAELGVKNRPEGDSFILKAMMTF